MLEQLSFNFLSQNNLLWLILSSDTVITLTLFAIPSGLFYVIRKRADISFIRILSSLGLFIFLCGTIQLVTLFSVWLPQYWLLGILKLLTAVVSIITLFLVWSNIPKLISTPSSRQLLSVNKELEQKIIEYKDIEKELRKFSLAIEHSPNPVYITNMEGIIEYSNPAATHATGYKKHELLGSKPSFFQSDITNVEVENNLWSKINSGLSWQGEFLDRKKNGKFFWCLHSISPIINEQGQSTHLISVAHDISERKIAEGTIKDLAYYDPLTKLPNRALFKERMEQAVANAKKNDSYFAVMYLDLDRFKTINDTLGHLTGDKLLIEVGRRLKAVLRGKETVSRLGGDEFAILITDLAEADVASKVANNIIATFNNALIIEGHELFITTSIGIAIYPTDAIDTDSLIKDADAALYHAKDLGRNSFSFFNQNLESLNQRNHELQLGLRTAIQKNELSLLYQPKVDVKTQKISGVEALIRWESTKLGPISPVEFIPVAEDTGLINKIGEWVIHQACKDLKAWKNQHDLELPISINLSPRQFRQANFFATIDKIIFETGIQYELLEFEITESSVMSNPDQAIIIMQEFKSRGLTLSIDDFGTGYSSLSQLKHLPVDNLKIDRSFVQDVTTDLDDACIVSSTVALAHGLGLKVIAEGVETQDQLEFLKKHNCDQFQGYFFSRPIASEKIIAQFSNASIVEDAS